MIPTTIVSGAYRAGTSLTMDRLREIIAALPPVRLVELAVMTERQIEALRRNAVPAERPSAFGLPVKVATRCPVCDADLRVVGMGLIQGDRCAHPGPSSQNLPRDQGTREPLKTP